MVVINRTPPLANQVTASTISPWVNVPWVFCWIFSMVKAPTRTLRSKFVIASNTLMAASL